MGNRPDWWYRIRECIPDLSIRHRLWVGLAVAVLDDDGGWRKAWRFVRRPPWLEKGADDE